MEIKAINNVNLEKASEKAIVNLCPLPCVCDGETCKGGWCDAVCWGD